MLKGRSGIIFVIVLIALLAILALLLRQRGLPGTLTPQQPQIPIDLRDLIPTEWKLLDKQPQQCDLDNDGEPEWLVLYRYDTTKTANLYATSESYFFHSPIGGVVYDPQVNRVPQALGNISPYRPALLVPYKLLPDFYTDKGQGYLGENDVKFYPYAPEKDDSKETARKCYAEELYFLGYSYLPLPTRLSIFRWAGREVGYQGVHFVGDAHVDAPNILEPTTPITTVTTYNRLANHRSVLCEVKVFERKGALNFELVEEKYTIDFCFGIPVDPFYPEAVLVALLRGGKPAGQGPTGGSFLTENADVASPLRERLNTASNAPLQILSVTNQGAVLAHPERGFRCPEGMLQNPGNEQWWCGNEEAFVQAVVVLDGEPRRVTAHLISVANERVTANVHWRVIRLALE